MVSGTRSICEEELRATTRSKDIMYSFIANTCGVLLGSVASKSNAAPKKAKNLRLLDKALGLQ